MTVTQFVGWLLIAIPFIGVAALSIYLNGPLVTLGIFAMLGVIMGVIFAGVTLASD